MDYSIYRVDATYSNPVNGEEISKSYFVQAMSYADAVSQVEKYIGPAYMTGIISARDFYKEIFEVGLKTAEIITAALDEIED